MFDAPRMEFLGMIIGQGEVRMDEKKLDAIKEWKPPPLSRESGRLQDS